MPGSSHTPPPDPAAALYQGASGQAYHGGKRSLPSAAIPWMHRSRARKLQPWIQSTDQVVELGAGAGWNLAALRCARRVGCEVSDHAALREQHLALGLEFVDSLESLAEASFDVGLCHHALEHMLEPAAALRGLARVVRPGGRLLIYVPWERERRYRRFNPSEPNHHLHGWNAQTLGNLATVLGWTLDSVRIRRYGWDRFAARLAVGLHVGEPGFRLLGRVLIALNPLLEVELAARRPPR